MTSGEFAATTVQTAWEPPEEVVVSHRLAHAPGLQPEDYGVLIRLLLRDPNQPSSMEALSKEFQATGWKMGDSRLRGVMGRLKKAGHVRHDQVGYDPKSKRPRWAFMVYRNPANNPDHARTIGGASPQVRPTSGFPTDASVRSITPPWLSNGCAGQSDTAESNGSNGHPLDSAPSDSNGCAGQSDTADSNGWVGHPPHPPEGVVTPSPYPLVSQVPQQAPAAQEAEAGVDSVDGKSSAEVIADAYEFLQDLPRPWSAGRPTARKLAPLLAEAIEAQGWTLDEELIELLTDESGPSIRSYPSVLSTRIKDLPRYRTKKRVRGVPGQRHEGPAGLPATDCKTCYGSGWTDNVGERCPCTKVSVAS
ncbi:hypothetical protein ABZY44_17705 [Streptomyces sp. NPDC006544]|uniref:hypothetical protein n=1 Tax=Streptomyces sp. NPDC006544 TaxID=3154583 RepID=UPI0033B405A1